MTVIDGTRYSLADERVGAFRLRPYQSECVSVLMDALHAKRDDGLHPHLGVELPTGSGKGHPLDTEVPTPDGLRLWGDLRVGDLVYGADGRPTGVTAIYDRGELPTYRVTLKHGESVLVDGDHLWRVKRKGRLPRVVSTRWLSNQPLKDYDGWRWSIPVTAPVQRVEVDLPLHPYVVGSLIANGGMTHGGTILTTPDEQVIERVRMSTKARRLKTYPGRTCPTYSLPRLTKVTRALGMRVHSRDKRIPRPYLEASAPQRIALLQGLMVADGSIRHGGRRSVNYSTTSPGLTEDLTELVTSLGGTCSWSKADRDEKGVEYTGCILLPVGLVAFDTDRKVADSAPVKTFLPRSAIVAIEPAGTSQIRCITVAAHNSLYLITRAHIVTHNTLVFSALGAAWHTKHPGSRVMILAHRDELITQARKKYLNVVPSARVGIVKAARHEVRGNDVIVASVQSLNARRRERLGSWRPNLLIIDETHHASAKSYRNIIEWAGCPVVGVTATMSRSDGIALGREQGGVFDGIVYRKTILWMIRNGYLADVEGRRVVVDDLDLKGIRKVRGDYAEGELGERLIGSSAPEVAAKAVREHALDRPGVIFAPTVESAKAFTEAMRTEGFTCETVWGAMPLDRDERDAFGNVTQKSRRTVLREFDSGKIQWVSNCMVLTEGWDSPRAEVAVIARMTQSAPLFIQMAGRVLRPYPGKEKALILDIVGVTKEHELASIGSLAGKDPTKESNGKSLLELYGAPCDFCLTPGDECGWDGKGGGPEQPCCESCTHRPLDVDRDGIDAPEGPTRAVEADLFAGSRQQWLRTEAGFWFIPADRRVIALAPRSAGERVQECQDDECGGCSCHLGGAPCSHCSDCWSEPEPDGFDVIWAWQDKRGGGYVAKDISDLGYAMAQGEAVITAEEEIVARKAGAWRKRKATEKQIKYAKALGCYKAGMESMRAGQAGDIISVRKASARLDAMISARL